MKLSMKEDLASVAELGWLDMLKLMFGRELKVPGHPVYIRQQRAFEAFNLDARPNELPLWIPKRAGTVYQPKRPSPEKKPK
jgi:hypothetical protein